MGHTFSEGNCEGNSEGNSDGKWEGLEDRLVFLDGFVLGTALRDDEIHFNHHRVDACRSKILSEWFDYLSSNFSCVDTITAAIGQ
jgi:hypothetical protein